MTLRPASRGLASTQYWAPANNAGLPTPIISATIKSEVMGDFQVPYSLIMCEVLLFFVESVVEAA